MEELKELKEAIQHSWEVCGQNQETNCECAMEHRQLALWLTELKEFKEKQTILNHNHMFKQLVQVFEYAELAHRLNQALELLDPKGGYFGESKIYDEIREVRKNIYKQIKVHMNNSQVSERAMVIINNMRFIDVDNMQ